MAFPGNIHSIVKMGVIAVVPRRQLLKCQGLFLKAILVCTLKLRYCIWIGVYPIKSNIYSIKFGLHIFEYDLYLGMNCQSFDHLFVSLTVLYEPFWVNNKNVSTLLHLLRRVDTRMPSFKLKFSLGFIRSCYVIFSLSMVQAMDIFMIT